MAAFTHGIDFSGSLVVVVVASEVVLTLLDSFSNFEDILLSSEFSSIVKASSFLT